MTPGPTLDELIRTAAADAGSEEPLARLSAAASLSSALSESADALLGHFVDKCRRAGHSWAEIGSALGVTKQAAQKRWVSPPLERFTQRARNVLEATMEVGNELGHGYVGTEHMLLALFSEPDGIAARILDEAGITREVVVERVLARVPRGTPGKGGFTPKVAQVIQQHVLATALELGHNYIGTEHILLGLYRQADSIAATLLAELGLTQQQAEDATRAHLAGFSKPT